MCRSIKWPDDRPTDLADAVAAPLGFSEQTPAPRDATRLVRPPGRLRGQIGRDGVSVVAPNIY